MARINKSIAWIGILTVLIIFPSVLRAQKVNGWKELKGEHFIVYHSSTAAQAEDILRAAERYYKRIAKNLGYSRTDDFWLFDNRCNIYIYPSKELFHQYQPQAPEWSAGFADYVKRQILGFIGNDTFSKTVLPHEIAHLILKDYLGTSANLPAWIDEGIALSQEELRRKELEKLVWSSFQDRTFIPIFKLAEMRVVLSKHYSEVKLYYAQAALLVDYLIRQSRKDQFVIFCKQLRDGSTLDQALARAYGERLKSTQHLEKAFLDELASRVR